MNFGKRYFYELHDLPQNSNIILDIDGTITYEYSDKIDKNTKRLIDQLVATNKVYICSNGKNIERNKKVARLCKVEYIDSPYRKPSKKILQSIKLSQRRQKIVIGNLCVTDGFFAKNIGAKFIHVKTIVGPDESFFHKIAYFIDNAFISFFV